MTNEKIIEENRRALQDFTGKYSHDSVIKLMDLARDDANSTVEVVLKLKQIQSEFITWIKRGEFYVKKADEYTFEISCIGYLFSFWHYHGVNDLKQNGDMSNDVNDVRLPYLDKDTRWTLWNKMCEFTRDSH